MTKIKKKLSGGKTFGRVLIVNRGEIAVRIIRALRELGLESVAIYSDPDAYSLHRRMADFAIRLPGATPADTYLNIPKIMEAIKESGADAVHPGYGFLAESDEFASVIGKAGVTFIGPPVKAMQLMGNKIEARKLMQQHDVPVVPGCESLNSLKDLVAATDEIGFPIILKAAAGGGGRGMRVVTKKEDLKDSYEACRREAKSYFGNEAVFCERYIEQPRHIEFQVLFDRHGNGVHLFERDCSIQRRHQKLLEEAPSLYLNEAQREHLGNLALKAGEAVGYEGAGTVEFICESPDKAFFMEMNTRIQVEHPVTEMITGVDLIAQQIKIAMDVPLPFEQKDLKINGWAVEVRINAEDATKEFLPCPGVVHNIRLPDGPFVRVDTHLYPGYEIPTSYDSMVAKIITWGTDRPEAFRRMLRSLSEIRVEGVPTTAKFHEALLQHPDFVKGKFTTRFIEENTKYFADTMSATTSETNAALLAALLTVENQQLASGSRTKTRPEWRKAGRLENTKY